MYLTERGQGPAPTGSGGSAGAAGTPTGVGGGRRPGGPAAKASRGVTTTVVLLGVVSMLTDVSSESVAAVLPLYITVVLGLSPLAYGVVDALYIGVSATVRVLGGWLSDRVDRPKWVAFTGYALSAASRAALLPAAGFGAIASVVTVDRLGKGIRTAPRDALITVSSDPDRLGRSFGLHRAMDTAGAMVGPLLAFAILAAVPGGFDIVFVMSFAVAVVGVAVLGLLVPDVRIRAETPSDGGPPATEEPARPRPADETPEGGEPAAVRGPRPRLKLLANRRFGRLLAAAGLLGLFTVGDGFLYLLLQRRDGFAAEWFPLLYVGTSLTYLLLSMPLGRWADRVGRGRVFLGGHVVLLLAYLAAGGPVSGLGATIAALLLLGVYYAATDGVLAAIAGQMSPRPVRATGIGAVQSVAVAARALSSLGFGLVWTLTDRTVALTVVGVGLALAIPVAAWLLRGLRRHRQDCPLAVTRSCPGCL